MNNSNVFFDFVNLNFYPEFVYFLGFLWADGSIDNSGYHNKISIEIVKTDADDLIRIFNKIADWQIYHRKRNCKFDGQPISSSETTRFRVNSKSLTKFLVNHGYKQKNGSFNQILSIIPTDMHVYWFRGLFDGDGTYFIKDKSVEGGNYSKVRISVAGPSNQNWDALEQFCNHHQIKYRIQIQKRGRYSGASFIINCQQDISKFISIIFKERIELCLQRKHKKIVQIQEFIKIPK